MTHIETIWAKANYHLLPNGRADLGYEQTLNSSNHHQSTHRSLIRRKWYFSLVNDSLYSGSLIHDLSKLFGRPPKTGNLVSFYKYSWSFVHCLSVHFTLWSYLEEVSKQVITQKAIHVSSFAIFEPNGLGNVKRILQNWY